MKYFYTVILFTIFFLGACTANSSVSSSNVDISNIAETTINKTLLPYCEAKNKCGYMNKDGTKVTEAVYKETRLFIRNFGLAKKQDEKHYIYVNSIGKEIIGPKFDARTIRYPYFTNKRDGMFNFDKDVASLQGVNPRKYGVINDQGETVCEPEYDQPIEYIDGFAVVKKRYDDDFILGVVDRSCNLVLPIEYTGVRIGSGLEYEETLFPEGLLAVKRDGKWGYINDQFETVIPFVYKYASNFSNGLAAVRKDKKVGYIDKENNVVIPFINEYMTSFSDGVLVMKLENKHFLMKPNGNKIQVANDYYRINKFKSGVAIVEKNGKKGLINKKGEEIAPLIYKSIGPFAGFVEGYARALLVEKHPRGGQLWTLLSVDGQPISDTLFSDVTNFSNGLASVKEIDKKMRVYINKKGELAIPNQYYSARRFSENRASVRKVVNGKAAVIDTQGREITPYIYKGIGRYENGYAHVSFGDKKFYIDKNGKPVGFSINDVPKEE